MAVSFELERIIRPAAIVPSDKAATIVRRLEQCDVSRDGVWSASVSLWQRYDRPWDGPAGGRGNAELVGSIAVVYDQPVKHEITIYKVQMTDGAVKAGWTVDRLCDDALQFAGISLNTCPRAEMAAPPPPDPFRKRLADRLAW